MNTFIKSLFFLYGLIFLTSTQVLSGEFDPITSYGNDISILMIFPIFFLGLLTFFVIKIGFNKKPTKQLGFISITPHRPQKFYALSENVQNMVPIVEYLADEQTNVYSNLSKITLTSKPSGVFLEDKNYKISVLINRRRSRRCMLNDGDILDMGELTIMFQSPDSKSSKREFQSHTSGHAIPRARRTNSRIMKNCPSLIPADPRQKVYYLTKNITLIGRSEINDLIPKSKAVSPMHSRIEKVAGKYKLVDLSSHQGTFVNGRRVDAKFLQDNDEISFESIKYTFSASGKAR
ncbi:FHA domain-containing protein [bacterium]|nr:FHA domain-containing protein [bacterium]